MGLVGLSSICLVHGPPKNTECASKIFRVIVAALEEQIFHISSLISDSSKLESLQVLEPPNSNSNNHGKNSLVLAFWSLELYVGFIPHVGKAAPTLSSGSSIIQSIFALNYSAWRVQNKKIISCGKWSKDFSRYTWFSSNTHYHLSI